MITVHHLNNSRSQRILWLLEELGVPYEIKHYQRDPKTMLAPASLRAIHPLGKSPVITDDGITVAETGAIIEYLVDRYDNEHLVLLVMKLIFNKIETSPMPFFAKPIAKKIAQKAKQTFIQPNLENHLKFLEFELQQSEWFAGNELTAADIQMSFPLEAATARAGLTASSYPKLKAFLDRIHARPAYQRALKKGGEFKLG
jgi:glutathione S-transferase